MIKGIVSNKMNAFNGSFTVVQDEDGGIGLYGKNVSVIVREGQLPPEGCT
jgi:hypothetical protein